jgi:DNA-binding NtrC family response regulator
VLLEGETGTGKELTAEALHHSSARGSGPFVVFDCASIAPNLAESELFGHERGSFTGAERVHHGYFERADGGTLFLDEVSEMPLELQAKLLRVLEAGVVARVGGEKLVKINVRVIAATNRDLDAAVAAGKFRMDLLYRLKVFPIHLPPLRARAGDIPALAESFLAELNQQEGTAKTLAPAAIAILERCAWPGNVRELRNVLQRAFILADGENAEIGPSCLAPQLADPVGMAGEVSPSGVGGGAGALTSLAEAERRLILASLAHFGGDKRKTAEALGVSLRTLYNRLHEYNV